MGPRQHPTDKMGPRQHPLRYWSVAQKCADKGGNTEGKLRICEQFLIKKYDPHISM